MTNLEVINTYDQILKNQDQLKQIKGAKFNYMLLKNIKTLENEVSWLKEIVQPTEEYKKFEQERINLCEKYSKDESGNIKKKNVRPDGNYDYDINETDPNWLSDIKDLRDKYSEEILKREEQIKKFNEILDVDSAIEFHKVSLNDIPEDISFELMKAIDNFIIE